MQTIYYHFRKLTTLQNGKNSARKKVPQSARLSEGGGGCDRYLGNARIDPATFSLGLPLVANIVSIFNAITISLSMIIYAMSDLRLLQQWRGSVKWPVDKPQHFHLLCPTKAARHYPPPTNYPPPVHPTRDLQKYTYKRGLPKLLISIVSHFVPQCCPVPPHYPTSTNYPPPIRHQYIPRKYR